MKRPLPPLRLKALEKAAPIDAAALERVSAEEKTARQKRDAPKRRADRQPGELVMLRVYLSAPIRAALAHEALERGCSLSYLAEEILGEHLASKHRGTEAQSPPVPSYMRPKPR